MGSVTLAQVLTGLGGLLVVFNLIIAYRKVRGNPKQDIINMIQATNMRIDEANKRLDSVEAQGANNSEDIAALKSEGKVLCKGILACLKGLEEQGCNGPVREGIRELEHHLIESSH